MASCRCFFEAFSEKSSAFGGISDQRIRVGGLVVSQKQILVADDDEAIQLCLAEISLQEGWALSFARDGEECLEKIKKENPDLLILDQRMPRLTGEAVLAQLEAGGKVPPVILISAEKDLTRFGRFPFLVKVLSKPFDLDEFVSLVNHQISS